MQPLQPDRQNRVVDIRKAATFRDFEVAGDLIGAMAVWDIHETRRRGFPVADLASVVYGYSLAGLEAKFTQPKAALLIARLDNAAAGCLAFSELEDGTGEIQKFFVGPGFRERGIGKSLMTATLKEMVRVGFSLARLETVQFMTGAIALYRHFGFSECRPFRSPLAGLDTITICMEASLVGVKYSE